MPRGISGCHCHIPVAAAHASQIEQQLFPGGNRAHFRQQPMRHLRQIVVDRAPGSEMTVEILRGTERMTMSITVGKRPRDIP